MCYAVLVNPIHVNLDERAQISLLAEAIHIHAPQRNGQAWSRITAGDIQNILSYQLKYYSLGTESNAW